VSVHGSTSISMEMQSAIVGQVIEQVDVFYLDFCVMPCITDAVIL